MVMLVDANLRTFIEKSIHAILFKFLHHILKIQSGLREVGCESTRTSKKDFDEAEQWRNSQLREKSPYFNIRDTETKGGL